jgi:hypothetical protein
MRISLSGPKYHNLYFFFFFFFFLFFSNRLMQLSISDLIGKSSMPALPRVDEKQHVGEGVEEVFG